jgi:hypothetical protein
MSEVEDVLSGPRGRRFCGELACAGREQVWSALFDAFTHAADGAAVRRFAEAVRRVDPGEVGALPEPALLDCLAGAVASARYWQEPDEQDAVLGDPGVVDALAPIAEAILASPATGWWTEPVDHDRQRCVQWLDRGRGEPPQLTGAAEAVRSWRDAAVAEESDARSRPDDPTANWSGTWWSTPSPTRLVHTSRARPRLGATQLLLTEDDPGWRHARVWPLAPRAGSRVYEITGPEAWAALAQEYPLRVTRSRRHDWWRTTGRDGEWFIPDWNAAASDHDGVHLTVLGYLTTPGKAVEIAGGATVLAGWHPDTTFWLRDVLRPSGEPSDWGLRESDTGGADEWRPRPHSERRSAATAR